MSEEKGVEFQVTERRGSVGSSGYLDEKKGINGGSSNGVGISGGGAGVGGGLAGRRGENLPSLSLAGLGLGQGKGKAGMRLSMSVVSL